jgi:hypothetical protein
MFFATNEQIKVSTHLRERERDGGTEREREIKGREEGAEYKQGNRGFNFSKVNFRYFFDS